MEASGESDAPLAAAPTGLSTESRELREAIASAFVRRLMSSVRFRVLDLSSMTYQTLDGIKDKECRVRCLL